MSTGYFAQVTDGFVTTVRRVSAERIAEYPDLYTGLWIEVDDMSHYPAVGWVWDEFTGFKPPYTPIEVVEE